MTVPPSDGNQGAVFVADACALLAYLRDEDGAQEMEDILVNLSATVYAHGLNLSEVYYGQLRESGSTIALDAIKQLEHDGVEAYEMMDKAFGWMLVT